MFKIEFNPKCEDFLNKCSENTKARIFNEIDYLKENPYPTNAKKIRGIKENIYRLRVGSIRILYIVNLQDNKIYIARIDKRSKVYEGGFDFDRRKIFGY